MKRHKCPSGYNLVGRSTPLHDKVGRGGVAVYKKSTLDVEIYPLGNICPDAVVFEIENSNTVFLAVYIAPDNSKYKCVEIFQIIDFIVKNFKHKQVYIIGDLNARCATPNYNPNYEYNSNPDTVMNSYGRKLLTLCAENGLVIINGLIHPCRHYDSGFTYFRGAVKSQNDWCISSSVQNVESLSLLPKIDVSDHVPCSVRIRCDLSLSLEFMEMYTDGLYNYTCYEKSDNLKPKIFMENVDVSTEFIDELDMLAVSIMNTLKESPVDLDKLAESIDESLYDTCKRFRRRKTPIMKIPEEKSLCSSKNFHAIAYANIIMYLHLVESGGTTAESLPYLLCWQENKKLAVAKEEEEYNVRKKGNWKHLSKTDTKAIWKAIDYKEAECTSRKQQLKPEIIHDYFTGIFQAEHLQKNSTVDDVRDELNNYSVSCRLLDQEFTNDELNTAIRQSGRGIGLDGIEKSFARVFPTNLRTAVLVFFNMIFRTDYPKAWTYLALRPEAKKGHSKEKPKLRGVAISSLLSSLYDIIIDNRFKAWYRPNVEQAGFREGQGCVNQIFALYLLIELANSVGESLFIGFIDYEKAFDFINRYQIVKKLISRNAGSVFTRAIGNMYQSTNYVPKVTTRKKGLPITTKHGVTQGRRSSTSLFSFAVSDVPKAVVINESFLHGNHVLQLADDSTIITNSHNQLSVAFKQFIQESNENSMVTNFTKTYYLDCSNNPVRDPIMLPDGNTIHHADKDEHLYLGMWLIASNNIVDHIKCNLKHRAYNINKFHDWLNINETTPIQIKLHVLDSCLFAAYLYGCECWWKIDAVASLILAEERKLLKRILQVKQNTPNDIIYVELNRCDIVSTIKSRQYNFYRKFQQLKKQESTARCILDLCTELDMCKYYESLQSTIAEVNKDQMKVNISNSTTTYNVRYNEITGCVYNDVVYNEYLCEYKRVVITRWRLSSHDLRIETGRYTVPKTSRSDRKCSVCTLLIEDEHHVVFICPLYSCVRRKYHLLILEHQTISSILNPSIIQEAEDLGSMLLEIEKIRKQQGL